MHSPNDLLSELAVKDDLYILCSLSGPLIQAESCLDALRKAINLSAKTESPFDAPSYILRLGTNEKLDAYGIAATWDALGWERPTARKS
jgi:hypothetical protein